MPDSNFHFSGAGGTPGGVGEFLVGVALLIAGVYLVTASVTVSTGYWTIWGRDASGLSLIPLILGVGTIFFNGRSRLGWGLVIASMIIILAGILLNLHFQFQPTSLFNVLLMLTLMASGLGLILRSLRPH
jgi:hypothetical protein